MEDMQFICASGSWSLKPGLLRLSLWTPDFNPELQRVTHSQCWVKISGLPHEYWCPTIIFTIAGGVGTPITLDEATKNRAFGHFARALVEVNLSTTVPSKILVERDGFEFFVGIEVENMPAFCSKCHTIGHLVANCKRSLKEVVDKVAKPSGMVEVAKQMAGTTSVVEQAGINLVIDLEIDSNKDINIEGMKKLLNMKDSNSEVSSEGEVDYSA
ncbi:putative transcription factor interactor and regulator CCHC(Zn) family [Lupinus albus]|uniref:Putative transcription factor interactor and regulator CCHC(Zn) family n=1 Tax=Lupinus albus TaxID=3870 RepID=A0A6A4PKN7_LUPAL|nr:putative transcription factor interactor and regulator CCHC(Zn) family [Lupinus albus]